MEFSEAAKANAAKFLAEISAGGAARVDEDQPLPVRLNWNTVSEEEVEAECLDMARSYLARK